MVEYRPLGVGRLVDSNVMEYAVEVPPGRFDALVLGKLAEWVCRRRCPYTGECLERWCPAVWVDVAIYRGAETYISMRRLPACARYAFMLEPGAYRVRLSVLPLSIVDEIKRNPTLVSLAVDVRRPWEDIGYAYAAPAGVVQRAGKRALAAELYARLGVPGMLDATRQRATPLIIPPVTEELVVFDGPVYVDRSASVYAGPAPAILAVVRCDTFPFEGYTFTNPVWCDRSAALTRLGGIVEVCVDGRCERDYTVKGYWGGGYRIVSMGVGRGVHWVRVRLVPSDRSLSPEHGVYNARYRVTVWDGHLVRGVAAAAVNIPGVPMPASMFGEAAACLGETASVAVGRAYADVEVSVGGFRGRFSRGSTITVDLSKAFDTRRVRGEAVVELPYSVVAPNTRVFRLTAPRPATLSEVSLSSTASVYVPNTAPVFEPMRASGRLRLRLLTPVLRAEASAPRYLDPEATGRVAVRVANTGRCRGRFTASIRGLGRSVSQSFTLEPGGERLVALDFTMPVGDVEFTVEARLERADGVVERFTRSLKVSMFRTVWLNEGVIEVRGSSTRSTVALAVAAAWLEPLVETESKVVLPGIMGGLIVARLEPYERVRVARYKGLFGVRMKASEPYTLALGRRVVRRRSTEAEYTVFAAAETVLDRLLPLQPTP